MSTIGFIGAGNMGGSIISGMIVRGGVNAADVYVTDPRITEEIKSLGVNVCELEDTVKSSDYIVLAVKPNIMGDILERIAKITQIDEKVFITIAAGVDISYMKLGLGKKKKIVRVMPNLPMSVGEGMSVICSSDEVTEEELAASAKIFSCVGRTAVSSHEDMIDKCLAINGSGPAYVFMFIEALADGAVKNGVPRKDAYDIAAQTVLGAAKLVIDSGMHPGVLKDMVCSPGGTTIDAVCSLEADGFRSAVIKAVEACTKKAESMKNDIANRNNK